VDNLPRSRGIGDGRLACRGAQTAGYSPGFATTCPAPLTAQLYANSISCPSPKKSFDAVHVSHWYTTRRSSPLTNASPAAAAGAEHLGQCQTAGVRGGVLGFGFMVGFSFDIKQTGPKCNARSAPARPRITDIFHHAPPSSGGGYRRRRARVSKLPVENVIPELFLTEDNSEKSQVFSGYQPPLP